jgi:hypothetical protein
MISSCVNDFQPWSLNEQVDLKIDYANRLSIDELSQKYKRHSNVVLLELIRQRLVHEESPENTTKRHTRFDYDQYIDLSDSEDTYDPYDLENHVVLIETFITRIKRGISWLFSFFK